MRTRPVLPVFVSGNQNKADYLSRQLGVRLEHHKLDLIEPQSTDLHKIVEDKLRQAYEIIGKPVLVEDVSLGFEALGGLPGPYIKWFLKQAGPAACCRLLNDFSDRRARMQCSFGYYDGLSMHFFDSQLKGTIAPQPRGDNGFGFDSFFIMEGSNKTFAELPQAENERLYAELKKPFAKVRQFLIGGNRL